MRPSPEVAPQGGRVCRRATTGGSALVGILHLPQQFIPLEGASYALEFTPSGLRLDPTALSGPLDERMQSFGIGDLLARPIWNRSQDPNVQAVRFIEAFPQDNAWTVYGPSHHQLGADAPVHAWFDIDTCGTPTSIAPPFEAAGSGIGQMLSSHPAWPDRQGVLYTLPQIQSSWRPNFLAYHQFLADSVSDPDLNAKLEQVIAQSPIFRELNMGRVDRAYCQYLATLKANGLLTIDAPQTAQQLIHHAELVSKAFGDSLDTPVPRRSMR